ncbi:hypothetical protein AB205_0061110 [Aquarana catesbeiana]|uniref:Uncharacterized protein n=1 Tax=Aquarana catesbeiana TaxID=8400 RepID=A0A2G9RAN9_AQUCT|nr:hypothetical protein AB205_0061110 [Aquarana catesbeiana]
MLEPILESKRQALLDKYELLTQMKSTFEKKLQRQHELSEVFIFCIVSVLANLAKSRVLQSVYYC